MQKKILSSLMLGLILSASGSVTGSVNNAVAEKKVWITIGDAAFNELKQISPKLVVKESRMVSAGSAGFAKSEGVHLVQINE